jgi:hypothetical protein
MERARGNAIVNSLSMYSITENIYYSQLSSVAILLHPEPVSHRIIQGNDCAFTPTVLSSFGLPLPPTCIILTVSEARSYFASTIFVPVLMQQATYGGLTINCLTILDLILGLTS